MPTIAETLQRAEAFHQGGNMVEAERCYRDILAVDPDVLCTRRAQRDMEHRAVLGRIDPITTEHRRDALRETAGVGEIQQQTQRFVADSLLGVIEIKSRDLATQTFATGRVVGKDFAQMTHPDLLAML